MEFRVLGLLEVSASDGLVRLTSLRQQKMLALLLINADRAVSSRTRTQARMSSLPGRSGRRTPTAASGVPMSTWTGCPTRSVT
ncbi:hypothetical protein JOF56_008450 [Kibdelosporangium banguiense]|uniref:Uncharacterized protein n=1 Tax=Kibdelosporangium banguiense TaxID=1365924 RepID=A0ABS4TUH8_9PSEU|nr:hypothetical protein [Kibdelosporangium banguiense]